MWRAEYACWCFTLADPCQSVVCSTLIHLYPVMTGAFSYNADKKVSNILSWYQSTVFFDQKPQIPMLVFCIHYSRGASVQINK